MELDMADERFGNRESSPWKLGGLSSKQVAQQAWRETSADDVFARSAQLAYYFFFALFPLVLFLMTLLGLFAGPGSAVRGQLVNYLTRAMPQSASGIVQQTVQHTLDASGGGKLSFGILLALFSASAGMTALMDTLNVVFGVREGRSFLRQKATAVLLTIATGLLMCIAIALIVAGGKIANAVFGGALALVWQIAQYPVAIFFLLLSFSLIYYYAPNIDHPRWHWVTPGSAVGVALWVIASVGLSIYLHFFNSYSATYGMLGAVMILLLWFYVTGTAVLMGGEVNSLVEYAASGRVKPKVGGAGALDRDELARQEERRTRPAA
jgi:membrane protein